MPDQPRYLTDLQLLLNYEIVANNAAELPAVRAAAATRLVALQRKIAQKPVDPPANDAG